MASAWRDARESLSVIGISCALGALVGVAVTGGTTRGLLQGALSGAAVSFAVRFVGRTLGGTGLERWPFGAYIVVAALMNGAAILGGLATAALPWAVTGGIGSLRSYIVPFLCAAATSIAFTFWFALERLLGRNVLAGLLTGRYHRPRLEDRIFLFADLAGSTALAERLGEQRFHAFLNRLWTDVAVPVERHGGRIHRYIGDEVEVSWPVERGRARDCLLCAVTILERLAGAAEAYRREFGTVPRLRLALHSGSVAAGEMGALKREIVFSGDTVHTTSRILSIAKELNSEVIASGDLLGIAELPDQLLARPLGSHRLKGRDQKLDLFALEVDRLDQR